MKRSSWSFPCFFCGVDSTELKILIFSVIGGLALSTLLCGIGLWLKGSFKNTEELRDLPLKVEKD